MAFGPAGGVLRDAVIAARVESVHLFAWIAPQAGPATGAVAEAVSQVEARVARVHEP